MQTIGDFAREARLTKAFDGSSIEQPQIEEMLALIRSAPTSFNLQPGRSIAAASPEARGRVARSMEEGYEPNLPKLKRASHAIVFCCLTSIPQGYIDHLAVRQPHDGAFRPIHSATVSGLASAGSSGGASPRSASPPYRRRPRSR